MGRHFECRRRAKESRWATMSKVFPKLAKSITMAAKNGGPDPESNAPLRVAINNAKAQNLSKENIENAIKRAAGKDAADISEITYEGKGPHGSLFVIECATDNSNRSVGNLKIILNKNGGQLVSAGQLDFMFNRKSVVEFPVPAGRDLEELATKWNVADFVQLPGAMSESAILEQLEAAHVFALSSDTEALGIVLVEAMAMGVPVVTTAVGGTTELVHDGENGLTVPPGDPIAMAHAILKIAANPELAERFSRAGRTTVEQGYGSERSAKAIADALPHNR